MSILQPTRNGPLKTSVKRGYQLMINAAAHNSTDDDVVNRGAKCPRLDSDNELEDDENEISLEDMVRFNNLVKLSFFIFILVLHILLHFFIYFTARGRRTYHTRSWRTRSSQ